MNGTCSSQGPSLITDMWADTKSHKGWCSTQRLMTVGSHYQSRPTGGRERAVTGVLQERKLEKCTWWELWSLIEGAAILWQPSRSNPQRNKTSGLILLLPPDLLPVLLIGQTYLLARGSEPTDVVLTVSPSQGGETEGANKESSPLLLTLVPEPTASVPPRSFLEIQLLGPPDTYWTRIHFNTVPRWFVCTEILKSGSSTSWYINLFCKYIYSLIIYELSSRIFSLTLILIWVLWESNAIMIFAWEKCLYRIKVEGIGKEKECLQTKMQV